MRPIIFLAILVIFVSSPISGIGNTCPPIPFVPESGGAGVERLNNWCKSVGGTPRWSDGGNRGTFSCVNCPASGTASGASTGNPYEGLFRWFFSVDADAKVRAERKAALIRQLEIDRQDAINRQQTAQAQKLNGILQRLLSGDMTLKDFGSSGELQLKLGNEPILFQEYMSTPATSTTKAQISLKTGDEAVPPTTNSAYAATTTATTTNANNAKQSEISPEMKALAEELSKLSPEQQQKLLEAIKSAETKVAVDTTVSTTEPEKTAETQLSLKLTDAKTVADNLNTAANTPGTPEDLKKQAGDQFNQLQQVTATQTQTDTSRPSVVANASGPPTPPPTPIETQTNTAKDPCDAPPNTDPKTVDLRCVKQPLIVRPRAQTNTGSPTPPPTSNATQTNTAVRGLDTNFDAQPYDYDPEVLVEMDQLAQKLKWEKDERDRLRLGIILLVKDFDKKRFSVNERKDVWRKIKERDSTELQQLAASGQGMGMPGSGFQTGTYADCVVFALANAAGLPYGVVAARANELIREAKWRDPSFQNDPIKAFRKGLRGDEMVFLTEAFGQAKVVKLVDFPNTLKTGRPLLININPGHQVVLSKTFRYEGKIWYEMIDSQQAGPWQRRYLTADELNVILLENGVAFEPDIKRPS